MYVRLRSLLQYPTCRNQTALTTPILVRTKRVKEARDEAKQEIADYKAKREDEYKKFEAEVR